MLLSRYMTPLNFDSVTRGGFTRAGIMLAILLSSAPASFAQAGGGALSPTERKIRDYVRAHQAEQISFLEKAAPKQAAEVSKGVLVPAAAIAQRDGHDAVFVVSGDTAHQRAVQPAPQAYGEMRLLPAAVQAGDTVVVSPPEELKDGMRVKSATNP